MKMTKKFLSSLGHCARGWAIYLELSKHWEINHYRQNYDINKMNACGTN